MSKIVEWKWPEKVTLCEVGLRDGLQNEKKILSVEEKLTLLDMTVDSGIKLLKSVPLSIRKPCRRWRIRKKSSDG